MVVRDEDLITELFARATVLQSRAANLLQILDQGDASHDTVHEVAMKLYAHSSDVVRLACQLSGVDVDLVAQQTTYQLLRDNPDGTTRRGDD